MIVKRKIHLVDKAQSLELQESKGITKLGRQMETHAGRKDERGWWYASKLYSTHFLVHLTRSTNRMTDQLTKQRNLRSSCSVQSVFEGCLLTFNAGSHVPLHYWILAGSKGFRCLEPFSIETGEAYSFPYHCFI